jgi:hypothetical protein
MQAKGRKSLHQLQRAATYLKLDPAFLSAVLPGLAIPKSFAPFKIS